MNGRESPDEIGYLVKVYVYDLSHGMAAIYGRQLLGIDIDSIYHTSVVVYGKEFFLSHGIQECKPGQLKYGTPIEVIDMGHTEIGPEVAEEFLDELRNHEDQRWHASRYDLFENNCNHFTDVLLEFLVGRNLEDRILKLPQQVMTTPAGLMLKQMLSGLQP